jgi:hypothetical protein
MLRQEWETVTRVFGFTSVTLGVILALVFLAVVK